MGAAQETKEVEVVYSAVASTRGKLHTHTHILSTKFSVHGQYKLFTALSDFTSMC